MRSALAIVAFANGSDLVGVLALLETALAGLDRMDAELVAAHVDFAIEQLRNSQHLANGDGFRSLPMLQ